MAASRRAGLVTALVGVVIVAVAAVIGVRSLLHAAKDTFTSAHCDVGDYQLDTDQASVAAQMVGAVARYRRPLPWRADVLVLMAGLQESKLTNLGPRQGDRDSVGVLQQRPSQGWGGGDAARLNDVTEATTEFLDALVRVRGWRHMAPAAAIQAVQVSADGSAYAKHEPEARVLAAVFTGRRRAGITCSFDAPSLVAPAAKVTALVRQQLPVRSARAVGRDVRVPGASWQTVAWFVANADRLGVDSVSYAGRRWSRTGGWQPAGAGTAAVIATMATG